MVLIHGQESFLLGTRSVELAISRLGGMLGPVTFFPHDAQPIRPYAVAPWAEKTVPPGTPSMIAALRGDWFCSAFGENTEPLRGEKLPPHGETANERWTQLARGENGAGCWLQLEIDLPRQGGRCVSTTALLEDQSVIYQKHDLDGLSHPINPGHHATLHFPDTPGSGQMSFSPFVHARTYFEPAERPENRGYSWLKPDAEFDDITQVPCIDGSLTDLSRYPARRGFEDIAILCTDPALPLGWAAVTFARERHIWFALRDPRQFSCTMLWFSNGGRHYPPWSGRHLNTIGIEDITGYFHTGIVPSCRPNELSRRGIRTFLEPDAEGRLSTAYIQGVARIPSGFDVVATIEPTEARDAVILTSSSGIAVEAPCHIDFLATGRLPEQEFV